MIDHTFIRGDVFFARLKNIGGSVEHGLRPLLIVQNNKGNENAPTVIGIPLTTRIKKLYLPVHVYLSGSDKLKPSMALCEQLMTINKFDIGEFIDRVAPEDMHRIDKALSVSIGLTPTDAEQHLS